MNMATSLSGTPSSSTVLHNCGTSFHRFPFDQNRMVELPKLDSPSISTSFPNTNDFERAVAENEGFEDEKMEFGNRFDDWKSFDREVSEHPLSYEDASFSYSDAFDCFPDL